MNRYFIQDIEYEKNQYFNSTGAVNSFTAADNAGILELIDALDTRLNYTVEVKPVNAKKKFLDDASPILSKLLDIFNRRSSGDSELNETLHIIHSDVIAQAEKYIINLTDNEDFQAVDIKSREDEYVNKLAFLKENGYLQYQVPQTQEFLSWCDNQLTEQRKKYEGQEDWRGSISYPFDSYDFKIIEKFIRSNDILDIISDYKQMNMGIYYISVDYSHHRQKWFRHTHEYNRLPPTNYYHFDADEDVAKMLIYLTDVTEKDGPFKLVKGSNTQPRSPFLTFIHYAIDTKISKLYNKKDNLYGRGLFLYRKDLLMKFPSAIRGTTHFGDDLVEGSPLCNYLLNNTVTFTGNKGIAVLFDGFRGVHAGSNADKGERLALQIALRRLKYYQTPVTRKKSNPTLAEKVKYKVKSLLN